MQHSSSCSNNDPILPLSNPVLLGVVRNSKLSVYPVLSASVLKFMASILITIIRPQDLDLLPRLVLHKSFELLEPAEDLILGLQEVDPGLPGIVIDKRHIVLMATQRHYRHNHIHLNALNQELLLLCDHCSGMKSWCTSQEHTLYTPPNAQYRTTEDQ